MVQNPLTCIPARIACSCPPGRAENPGDPVTLDLRNVFPAGKRKGRIRYAHTRLHVDKVVVSVIGLDCPGVVYLVSSSLSGLECNIEEVSQTILKGQFSAIFVVRKPEGLDDALIGKVLTTAIADKDMLLSVTIRPFEEGCLFANEESEPFVVTVDGEDRFEIISAISGIFAEHRVNIENLKAIMPDAEQRKALLVFEIALPLSLDRVALRRTLEDRAHSLGLQLSMQHRDIFEAVHRVLPS